MQTKLAPVKIHVIAVSFAAAVGLLSHFATAQNLVADPADSMRFEAQAIPSNASAADILNNTTVNPNQTATNPTSQPAPGKPLVYQMPKANAQKDDGKNPMDQIMQMMGGSPAAKKAAAQTEAGFNAPGVCLECESIKNNGMQKIDLDNIPGYVSLKDNPYLSDKEKCYAEQLLPRAKQHVQRKYGNRNFSGGDCARGVRESLDLAGFDKSNQGLGHAIAYHGRGGNGSLSKLGFRLISGMTEASAPPGAVLVYAGPRSNAYLTGGAKNDGTGNTLGHVTIKGEDGYFYTDGKTRSGAGSNRTLVGVYVMSKCTNCTDEVIKQCQNRDGGHK